MKSKPRYYLAWLLVFLANFGLLGGCMKKSITGIRQNSENIGKKTLRLNFVAGDLPSLNPQALSRDMRGIGLGKWLF